MRANFTKSDKTDRWWIEIPFISNGSNKLKRSVITMFYEEYLWHVIKSCQKDGGKRNETSCSCYFIFKIQFIKN
jgi:hypothetical protein